MNDKSLSRYAHNIKIITENAQVALKGPVRSRKEEEGRGEAAEAVGGMKTPSDGTKSSNLFAARDNLVTL